MNRQQLIDELITDTIRVKQEVEEVLRQGDEMITVKPSIERWSILECIEHLNIAQSSYFEQLENKLSEASASDNDDFKPAWMGRYFVKSMKPKEDGRIPSPMKTLKKFVPKPDLTHEVGKKFLADQDRLLVILEQCRRLDLNKIKIKSAIGSIVTFSLGNALRFMIAHNQRHVVQMKNVLAELMPVS